MTAAVTILIVDDDDAVAGALALLLGVLGYRTVAGESAGGVCTQLEPGDEPALVISDYHLTRKESGVEVVETIRAHVGRDLPAILISGDTSDAVQAATESLANCHLLTKPADTDELIELVEQLLSSAQ